MASNLMDKEWIKFKIPPVLKKRKKKRKAIIHPVDSDDDDPHRGQIPIINGPTALSPNTKYNDNYTPSSFLPTKTNPGIPYAKPLCPFLAFFFSSLKREEAKTKERKTRLPTTAYVSFLSQKIPFRARSSIIITPTIKLSLSPVPL